MYIVILYYDKKVHILAITEKPVTCSYFQLDTYYVTLVGSESAIGLDRQSNAISTTPTKRSIQQGWEIIYVEPVINYLTRRPIIFDAASNNFVWKRSQLFSSCAQYRTRSVRYRTLIERFSDAQVTIFRIAAPYYLTPWLQIIWRSSDIGRSTCYNIGQRPISDAASKTIVFFSIDLNTLDANLSDAERPFFGRWASDIWRSCEPGIRLAIFQISPLI